MSRHPISQRTIEPDLSNISILGLLFFILGAPHGYASLTRTSEAAAPTGEMRYAVMVVLAGVLAGVVELSIHLG